MSRNSEVYLVIEYLSVKTYAELIGANQMTIYKMLERNLIKGAFKKNGRWLIPISKKTRSMNVADENWNEREVIENLKSHIKGVKNQGKGYVGKNFCITYLKDFLLCLHNKDAAELFEKEIKPFLKLEGMQYGKE